MHFSLQLTVKCYNKKTAPSQMRRGSATTDGQFAYFMPDYSNTVYRYKEKWDKLSASRYRNCALVIIDGALTTVGGWYETRTNKLLTFRYGQWIEELPPMITARSDAAVVSTSDGKYVLVIGGDGGSWIATVELLHISTRCWYTLTDLPRPPALLSATLCGNQVCVTGYSGVGYSCCLQSPPFIDEPIQSQSKSLAKISWTPLPRPPVTAFTAATLSDQLVIVGGEQGESSVNSIHQLVDGQWVNIGSLSSDRDLCLVVSPSPHRMVVVGGRKREGTTYTMLDSAEECTVKY